MAALKRAFWVICLPCGRERKRYLLLLGLLGEEEDEEEEEEEEDADMRGRARGGKKWRV